MRLSGNLPEARAIAAAALQVSTGNPLVHLELGEIALASGEASKAIFQAREAGSAGTLLLARACRADGRNEEATRALQAALEADPGNTQIFTRLIRELIEFGEFEMAEKVARDRIERKPRERKGWLLLGRILYSRESYGEAVRVFKKAITLGGPGFDRARVFLLVTESREAGRPPLSMIREHDHILAWELEPQLRRENR